MIASPPEENMATYWARVGPLLEQIRREEATRMTDEERARQIDIVLQLGAAFPEQRPTSGLVELERRLASQKP